MRTEERLQSRSHKPSSAWGHQKLEEAGRIPPQNLHQDAADTLILDC